MSVSGAFVSCVLALGLAAPAAAGPGSTAPPKSATRPAAPRKAPAAARDDPAAIPIEIHAGIPGVAYLGQPLSDLARRFPKAQVESFAKQVDAAVVKIPDSGISCLAVGDDPQDLKVASVGFIFDEAYQGVSEGGFRTSRGIGKGSTVNDLLEAYGLAEITDDRPGNPALRRRPRQEDPDAPKKYQYASSDGSVKTYFVVEGARVLRMVINQIAPLEKHIVKRPPPAPPPTPPAPSQPGPS